MRTHSERHGPACLWCEVCEKVVDEFKLNSVAIYGDMEMTVTIQCHGYEFTQRVPTRDVLRYMQARSSVFSCDGVPMGVTEPS